MRIINGETYFTQLELAHGFGVTALDISRAITILRAPVVVPPLKKEPINQKSDVYAESELDRIELTLHWLGKIPSTGTFDVQRALAQSEDG